MDELNAVIQAGIAHHLRGELQDAMACYKFALEMQPANPLVLYNCGCVFDESNQPAEAERFFQLAKRVSAAPGEDDPDIARAVREFGKRGVN